MEDNNTWIFFWDDYTLESTDDKDKEINNNKNNL